MTVFRQMLSHSELSETIKNTSVILTEILKVNLFAFAHRRFHEDFSPIYGALVLYWHFFLDYLVVCLADCQWYLFQTFHF